MSDDRTPRDAEKRPETARPNSWAPPETLPTPTPMEGYEFKWVRTAIFGTDDPRNVLRARRSGYEPVLPEEQPDLAMLSDSIPDSQRHKGTIEIGGLILCKIPKEFVAQRQTYYREQARAAQQAVDNNLMRENDPRMPLFQEKKTKVSFGSDS